MDSRLQIIEYHNKFNTRSGVTCRFNDLEIKVALSRERSDPDTLAYNVFLNGEQQRDPVILSSHFNPQWQEYGSPSWAESFCLRVDDDNGALIFDITKQRIHDKVVLATHEVVITLPD